MFRIGKFGKKVVSAVIAGAVVLGTLAVYPSETKSRVFAATNVLDYDSASSVNYNTILGRATDYGLLVGTMNQTGHMETTFATNKYIGETNNDVDLAGEAPSNIIIASVEPGSHPIFGKTRSSVFNIYTTEAIANIIEFDSQFNKGAAAFEGQTPPSYSGSPTVNFHYQTEPDLTENVNKMLEHTKQQSDMLAAKPSVDVSKLLKNGNVLDLSSEEYKGATIYIDVPAGSTIETLLRGADALTIKKYPSTNVVFNLRNTNLTINKFKVEVLNDDGTTKKTITSGDQQHSGDYSDHDADIEEYICKNIIFNAPNATKAKVMNTAGLFLFPKKADIIVNAAGGWLATPGKVTTEGEWHFFYQGRSKDINTSEKASFHFAAYKAFTTEFRGENTERLTNIYAGKDEYTFSFTETGSNYDTTGLTGTTVKTDENGYLFFPSLSVNIADVDPLNPQYHYYVIKETAVSSSSGMDAPSNGEMRMKVKVENNSGVIKFTIDHVTYLDSNHNEPKNVYKEEAGIVMSGTEFSLGAFINKVTIDKAKLSVTKEVYIDGNKAGADNATVRDAEFKYYLKKGNQYVQDLQGKLGGNPHEFKIKNGKIDKFENLNLGEYVIEEIKPGDLTGLDYSGNSITYANATSSGSTVTLAKDDNASATIRNDYTTVTITNNHSLQITKRATGLTPSYKDKEYRVSVKTSDGRYVQSLNGTIDTAEHYFTVKAGETIKIINLPSDGYVISEDTQDARVINYDLTSSVTPDYVNISDTENNANVEVKNDYTQQKGKLSIRKTFSISNPVTDNLKFVITGPENFSKEVEYSEFTNGEYTLPEDLPCGVYTVSEVGADGTAPVGYFYFKTYSGMNNPNDDSTECTVTVSNNQTVTAAFNNLYNEQQYGDLTVHKFVQRVGNISGIPDTFKIAIINSDGEYYDPAQSTDTNAVFTASPTYCTITTVNDNGTFTASHLPAGSYRLIENRDGTEVAGAVLTVTGEGSVHVIGNQGNNVYLSNTYTMYKLTVRKQASNAPYTGNTYQIAVKNGDSYVQADGSMNSKVHYFDITANGSITIPVQQSGTYEVFEKNENNSENNFYELVTTYKVGDGEAASTHPSIELNDTNTSYDVTVINTYTRKTTKGYITLEKTISGDVTDEDLKGLTFTVKDSDGKTVATLKLGEDFEKVAGSGEGTKGTYKLKDSKLIEVDDASKTYTVEETLHTLDGFDVTVTNKIGGGSETTGTTANVTGGVSTDSTKPTEVAFENNYKKKTGSLVLQKTVDGPAGCVDPDTEFTFYVKGEDGKWYDENGDPSNDEVGIKIKAGDTNKITINNIPAQLYQIYEADASSQAETGYEYLSADSTKSLDGVAVPAGGSTTATLINKYKKSAPTTGSLTLKKTVEGPDGAVDANTEFTFYVKGADGKWYDENGTPSEQKAGIKIKAGDANIITINNLPVQTYDITEDDAASAAEAGYEFVSGTSTTYLNGVEVKAGETTPSELINKYTRSMGGLSLTKTIDTPAGCNATEFTFYVKGADGKWYDKDGKASDTEVGITVPADGTVTITSIPVQKYTVTEADATGTAKTGYEVDSSNSTIKLENVSVTKGAVTSAELINAYKRSTGKLKLLKTISGETAGANTSSFTFYVKGEDGKWYDENGAPSTTQVGITVPAGTTGVTIENLPTQKYTITEADASATAAAGYEYDATGSTTEKKTVEVAANATASAELINKYKASEGSLKLIKTISGPTGCTGATEFTFYVKGEDGKWYDKDGKASDTEVGVLVVAGTTGVTISGLPVQKYTITEADASATAASGFEYDAANSTTEKKDVAVTANATASAELINKYKASEGSLKLIKTVDGPTGCTSTTDFTFYVKGEDGKWYDESGAPSTTKVGITVPAGTTGVTISGLPVQKYTITEADASATAASGFEYDAANSTTEKKDVAVTANATASAELINKYKTSEGSLKLIKTISGPTGCTGATEFTFYVKGEDGKWYDKDGKASDTEVGVLVVAGTTGVTISGLPVQKYTITEADATGTAAAGYEYAAAGSTTEKKDVAVTANTTVSAELINKYKELTGSLILKKTISAPTGYTTTKKFKFYVKGEDGKWYDKDGKASASEVYVEVPANSEVTISGLKLQKYDITEADATGTAETGYTYDASNSTTEKKGVEVTANAAASAELINAYKEKAPDTGSLQLKKTISAPSGYTTSKTFKFYVKGADGKWYDKDGTPSDTEVYVEVPANGTVKIDNLPLQKYDVTEADATGTAETGYEYDASNSTTEKKGVSVTASAVATAELTNAYKLITGSLTLKKTVSGPSGSTTTNNFTFYVKGADGKWYDKDGKASSTQVGITVKGNDTNGVTLKNIPVQKYDITEDDGNAAAANGYELDGTNSDVSKQGIDVTQDTTTTVTLVNAYKTKEVDKGSLTLKKTVSGPDGSTTTNNFTFYVKGEDGKWYDKDGKASDTQVGITVKGNDTNGVTISNLPVQKYDITEKTEGTAASGYEIDGANSVTSKPGVDVTKDTETTVTLVNAYKTKDVDTGSLTLKKTVTGETGGANTTKFTFYVKGENGKWYDKDGKASDTQVGITVDSSDTDGVTIAKLPVQKYDITEKTEGTAASGYELDTANSDISKDDVEVTKDNTTTVTLKNAYKTKEVDKGSLTLKKKVTGEAGGANTTNFTFYVKGENGKWYDKDGKASSTQVGITVSSIDTDGVTITGIPAQKYDITEKTDGTAASGYELDGANSDTSKDNVEVTKDNTTTVTLTNAYKTKVVDKGKLTLSKTVQVPEGCKTTTFTFYVKGADGKWYGADGKPSNDQVEIKVTAGTPVTINDLPVQTYTVTEKTEGTAANGYELDGENSITKRTNISVEKDQETTAQLINVYKKSTAPETGSIKVAKVEAGTVPTSGIPSTYSFYVKCGTDYLKADGTFGDKSDAKVFKVAPGSETEVTGLELGKTYTIEEASFNIPDGYTVSITYTSSKSVTLDSTNKSDSVKITNTYISKGAPLAGSIVVTKRIAGSVPSSGMPDTYRFYIKCGDLFVQNDGSLGEDKHMFSITPNKSLTIIGLDTNDKTYQVVEEPVSNSDLPDGYKWSVVYSSESVTLTNTNNSGDVEITNNYTHKAPSPNEDKGSLELKKTVSGPSGCTKTSSFTFYVKGADKNWYDKNGTAHSDKAEITVKAGETVTITGLPVQTYTITEKDPADTAADGFEIDGNKSVPTRVNVEVVKDGTAEAELINVYKTSTVDTGSLTLKKTVTGPSGSAKTTNFTFYVKGEDGKWYDKDGKASSTKVGITVSSTDTDGVKISKIPVQKYDITEDTSNTAADGYELDTANSDTSKDNVAVTKDNNTTVTLTNAYKTSTVDTGSLVLKKTVAGEAGGAKTTNFTFYVKGADGKWYDKDGKASSTKVGVTVSSTDTNGVKITGIPVQKYDISEDTSDTAADGYELDGAASDTSKDNVDVTKDNTTTVTLINAYKTKTVQETGDIILKKTVSGDSGCTKTTDFTFYVKGEDGKWYDKDGKASSTKVGVTVSSTDANGVKISGIPVQKYDITEDYDNTAADNYELDGTNSETSKPGVTVTKDTTPTVTLVNAYKKTSVQEKGNLVLKKTVTGEAGGAKTTNFTFYVKGADGKWYDKDGKASSTKVGVTVSSTDTNGVTIKDIPVQKYDITEDTSDTASSGYELDTNASTTSRVGVTVTAATPGEATLINSYKRQTVVLDTGSLAFTKTFSGDIKESEAAASAIYFVIERTDTTDAAKYLKLDGTFTANESEARIKLADLTHTAGSLKWSVEINDIPVGKYKVTESDAKVKIDGTNVELVLVTGSSVTSQTANVTKNSTGNLDLINNYKVSDYDVKISKQDIAKKELPKATLTLTSLDGYDLSGAKVKQGSKTISVKVSADKKSISFVTGTTPSLVTGLKYGSYELKETVTPEAYLTADAIKFTIDRAGNLYDENGSVIVSGSPIVMIDRADPNYKKPTPSGKNKVPATGVGTSYAPAIGIILLAISIACGTAVVIFRTRKRKQ